MLRYGSFYGPGPARRMDAGPDPQAPASDHWESAELSGHLFALMTCEIWRRVGRRGECQARYLQHRGRRPCAGFCLDSWESWQKIVGAEASRSACAPVWIARFYGGRSRHHHDDRSTRYAFQSEVQKAHWEWPPRVEKAAAVRRSPPRSGI